MKIVSFGNFSGKERLSLEPLSKPLQKNKAAPQPPLTGRQTHAARENRQAAKPPFNAYRFFSKNL